MAKKDSSKNKLTEKEYKRLNLAFNEVKDFDDTPNTLEAFAKSLVDKEKGDRRLKILHDRMKKYDDVPDDINQFAIDMGVKKKSSLRRSLEFLQKYFHRILLRTTKKPSKM